MRNLTLHNSLHIQEKTGKPIFHCKVWSVFICRDRKRLPIAPTPGACHFTWKFYPTSKVLREEDFSGHGDKAISESLRRLIEKNPPRLSEDEPGETNLRIALDKLDQ